MTSLKLYKSVVQSTFLYGCELWNNLTQTKIKDIEKFHHYCLKKIQYLPGNTRSVMCESLLGVCPLNSPKSAWKRVTQNAIHVYERNRVHALMANDTDFIRFRSIHKGSKPYHLWKIPSNTTELKLIQFIIRCTTLLPSNINQLCSYCNRHFTDLLSHIVTSCENNLNIRNIYLEYIGNCYNPQFSVAITNLDNEEFLNFLLGKHNVLTQTLDEDDYKQLVIVSANYVVSCVKRFYS